ncbi:hypothetical protein HanXRQr2_Chr09g0385091 [Helianthus annuus]|uniref:Uncharacterized protein n=1 Tax=Helianthus annuus TaxID=4232 RepID=A0A9K3N834_HELAN|nr:hypothetical protein HanXRQr2_Chr09g0385091 [Helianthus annuus]KAJ0525800.1 hypothetical protein HanHA300_Chr09g0316141 [Helianthus annuus]KAJ0707250.1 hypothetical protein HanLR1_Chr09g0316401 [Helianthus annuus]KAJ0711264.1 hypothetical protein HanOQP8_Chr09g0321911 [Helianthus annuus]KAJ0790834.1 hypothetical protein HanLR1_Chr00c3387g0877791 [Helianthus annuus]
MNFALNPDLFDDQYSMSLCEGFFRGAGMLQWVNELRKVNEELRTELRTSQTVAAELRYRVTDVERRLLEEKEGAWEKERVAWAEEKEELADLETMYTEWGMATDDNQRLAQERYWLFTQRFGLFLSAVSQSEEFKGSLDRIYRTYRDVGYQAGLEDGYTHSSQGLKRKETPLYNSKSKKQLSKLDKEFGEKTPALLEKILERPLMSIDELKALLAPAGPSSPKSLSRDASSCRFRDLLLIARELPVSASLPWIVSFLRDPPKHRSWFEVCLQTFVCVSVYSICSLFANTFICFRILVCLQIWIICEGVISRQVHNQ